MSFEIKPAQDGKSVWLELPDKRLELSGDDIEALMRALAGARSQLSAPAPMDPPKTFKFENDPRFWVSPDPESGGGYLLLRDSGKGWLSFRLPPAEAEKLAALLNEWATKRAPSQSTGPDRLYKYLRRHHLDSTLKDGIFRIGTLYDFRRIELGPEVGDPHEGRKSVIQTATESVTFDMRGDDPRAVHARRVIGVDGDGPQFIMTLEPGGVIEVIEDSNDAYVFSASMEYSLETQARLDCHACLEILHPVGFLAELTKTLGLPKAFGGQVQYGSVNVDFTEADKTASAGFLKNKSYENQKEYRFLWPASQLPIEPILIRCPAALEYCRLVVPT